MKTAFDTAVTHYGPTVLRVCRAVLGPGPDADDAWSETFLSALRAWPHLPADTEIEGWLVRVAHRRAVDVVRRSARTARPMGAPQDYVDLDVRNDDELGDHTIWNAVATLPTKQRQCVAYRYLGGLSYVEIAGLIGGTAAAARRATSDGVTALRAILGRDRE